MATGTAIAATTAADTAYTLSVDSGGAVFRAFGLQDGEEILVESKDLSGGYDQLSGWTPEGRPRRYVMARDANSVKVNGPVDIRLNKRETAASVSVVRYT
jgi:hypothetical protein